MAVPDERQGAGPGPVVAIVGAVIAAVVLVWVVDVVIGTFLLFARLAVLLALVAAGFWVWGRFSRG
jgi:hypothetical protein